MQEKHNATLDPKAFALRHILHITDSILLIQIILGITNSYIYVVISQPNMQEVALFDKIVFYLEFWSAVSDITVPVTRNPLNPRMKTIVSIINVTPTDASDLALGHWRVGVHNQGLQLNTLSDGFKEQQKWKNNELPYEELLQKLQNFLLQPPGSRACQAVKIGTRRFQEKVREKREGWDRS